MKYLLIILVSCLIISCGVTKTTQHVSVVIYDTTHKTWCCKIDTLHKPDTTFHHKDSTRWTTKDSVKWNTIPKDSIKWTVVKKDSIKWTTIPKDSIKWTVKPKDTTIFIPLFTDNSLKKYLNNGNQVQVKFTVTHK